MTEFEPPWAEVAEQGRFGEREVGIVHPDIPSFVRLRDSGEIEIVAGEGLSILMSPKSKSITFVADHIKFMTKHEGGLRWNQVSFNDRATAFSEPTFIVVDDLADSISAYQGVEEFFSHSPKREVVEVTDTSGAKVSFDDFVNRFRKGDDDG